MTATTALDARWAAVRAGLSRGWTETRQASIFSHLFLPLVVAMLLIISRTKTVPGTDFALGAVLLPGFLGFTIASGGFIGSFGLIAPDAEDGTLLRAKATPNGMLAYLVGKIVMLTLKALVGLIVLAAPGIMVASHLVFDARTWLLLTLTFVAGMVATVPIGLALGSLAKSSMQAGLFSLAASLLVGLPIFIPLTVMPTWLQWLAQAFPFYWVGLGARAALLPAEMAATEIGQSWRTIEMFGVLGVWAVIGMLVAPTLLRRMARRLSGSKVAATRERVMSRGY